MRHTKRARIFTGMRCNARCTVCYYLGRTENRTMENIRRQIDLSAKYGMRTVEFSGGEPTVRKDLLEMIKYAKSKGLRTSIVTNGIKLADEDYTKTLARAGLDEALVSVHGSNPEEHAEITQVKGSFEKMMRGIQNLKKNKVMLRTNTTVFKTNHRSLEKHAELFLELKPYQCNFILFNDWDMASKVVDRYGVKYSEAAPYLKKAIRRMEDGGLERVNVRYIPFCFMRGFEKNVCDYRQKIYDPFEWSQKMLSMFGETESFTVKEKLKHHLQMPYGFIRKPSKSAEDLYVSVRRMKRYQKPGKCRKCRFDTICDGLEKSYVRVHGTDELKPVSGEKIADPLSFRHGFYKEVE